MRKQVINKDEEKMNIVILSNDDEGILVKGVSRCHEEDTYNKDFGLKLANTRAWLKYYKKLGKTNDLKLEYANEILSYWQEHIKQLTITKKVAEQKYTEIKAEYDEMMETV